VKAGTPAGAGEIGSIQAHQHDHLVGDGPHRLQGTDGERTTAVPEATAVHGQSLLQHLQSHRHIQLERAGLGPLTPALERLGPALQLTTPGTAVTEQLLQLPQQQR